MKITAILLTHICSIFLSSCSKKLTSNLSTEQQTAAYKVLKDLSYGSEAEQIMDIYLSQKAKSLGKRNYTIVFLHGGGYYFSYKSQEERYIEPYLKKRPECSKSQLQVEKRDSPCHERPNKCLEFPQSQQR